MKKKTKNVTRKPARNRSHSKPVNIVGPDVVSPKEAAIKKPVPFDWNRDLARPVRYQGMTIGQWLLVGATIVFVAVLFVLFAS